MTAMATLGLVAQAAQAAPAAPNDTVTLVRADKSTVTVPWQTGPDGVRYAMDPRNNNKSLGVENAAIVEKPASVLDDCPSGYVCLFEHGNWGGHVFQVQGSISVYRLGAFSCAGCVSSHHPASNGSWDDQMSSWKNFSGWHYCWAFDPDGTGERHDMPNGIAVSQVTGHENDEATSLVTC